MGKEKVKSSAGVGKRVGVKINKKLKIKKCAGVGTKSRTNTKDTGKSLCRGGKRKLEGAGADKKGGGYKKTKIENEAENEESSNPMSKAAESRKPEKTSREDCWNFITKDNWVPCVRHVLKPLYSGPLCTVRY